MSTTAIEQHSVEIALLYGEICATVKSTEPKLARMEELLAEIEKDEAFPWEMRPELIRYQQQVAQIKEQFAALPKD